MRDETYVSKQVSFSTDLEAVVTESGVAAEQSGSAYWGFIQVNRGSEGIHQSYIQSPSEKSVKIRCCDGIWPVESRKQHIMSCYHSFVLCAVESCLPVQFMTNNMSFQLCTIDWGIYSASSFVASCSPGLLFALLQNCVACLTINGHSTYLPLQYKARQSR